MEKFIKKQDVLNKALEKVKSKLDSIYASNDWLDLQFRLQRRLQENYYEYQRWHFEEKGWVAL